MSEINYLNYKGATYDLAPKDGGVSRTKLSQELQNTITRLQSISNGPLIASTAAQMTDITKVYVYVGSESGYTNGNWYYYNGSAWTSGGVYNSTALQTDTTLTVSGQAADAKKTGNEIDRLEALFTIPTQEAVDNWLEAHPEATTTVQDESLTYKKLVKGTLGYVTPEMFGAVGDGVIDDTEAWQSAVDFGINVKATKKIYKCGQINVTKNIEIDCNSADFICTGTKLFYCTGEIVNTLRDMPDYTANQINYSIPESNYTGFAMLKGTNNFEKARTYYLGGFVCEFWNGNITTAYPIDVTDVRIEIIKPITVHFSNIGNIKHPSISNANHSVTVLYGFGCTIKNCNMSDTNGYIVINLNSCLNCIVSDCNIKQEFASSSNNSYLIGLNNTSFCTIENCYMYNKNWHCISTGDTYLCYHNMVDKCKLYSDLQTGFEDHENALNSIITNSKISSVSVCALGVIENCTIVSNKTSAKNCRISLLASSMLNNAVYNINNVMFFPDSGGNSNYMGIGIGLSPQTSGQTFYIKQVNIHNVKCLSRGDATFRWNFASGSNFVVYDINFKDCDLNIYGLESTVTNVDITNNKLSLTDCNKRNASGAYSGIFYTGYVFNEVYLNNVILGNIVGTIKRLFFNNLKIAQTIGTALKVTDMLRGSGLHSRITEAALLTPTYIDITDMLYADNNTWFNLAYDSSTGKRYYSRYAGGQWTSYEITA